MNCQDITHLIDSGKFTALSASEQRDAEAHARSCRQCAPLWFAHARLAAGRVPAMPPELSVRCLTLAAAHAPTSAARHASRRIMVAVGGLIVLAAAASIVGLNLSKEPAQQVQRVVDVPPPVATPAEAAPAPDIPAPVQASESAVPAPANRESASGLPLLPAPTGLSESRSQMELAMRKALELYPEIANGPEIQGQFIVSLMLRADGTVLRNSMLITTTADEANAELRKSRPSDGSSLASAGMAKGARLADGRTARGTLLLQYSMVSNDFDPARSDSRVREIVRANRAHLMLPASSGGFNTLTVFLAEDGTIQRDDVEFNNTQEYLQKAQTPKPTDPGSRAKDMAAKLGISADQIGLMGFMAIQDDAVSDPAQPSRGMVVNYAWPRRPGEVAPVSGQAVPGNAGAGTGIDIAAALTIVEHMIPEAFFQGDQASRQRASTPAVVLTAEGRVISVGRVNLQSGELMEPQIRRINPGVEIGVSTSVSMKNSAGQQAHVFFAWEATPAQKEAAEKRRLAPPAK